MPFDLERAEPAKKPERPPKDLSIEGPEFEHVSPRLKRLIQLALRAQVRVEHKINSLEILNEETDLVTRAMRGMNCHKTVLYARGAISRQKLMELTDHPEEQGHPEVMQLAHDNPDQLALFAEDITDYAEENPEQLPYSVHVFLRRTTKNGVEDEPHHSFLLLGKDAKGRMVCFHKAGPYSDHPFELTTLEDIVGPYEQLPSIYLVLPVGEDAADA